MFTFQKCRNVLIIGAGHGIGLALVKELLSKHPHTNIYATFRDGEKADDLLSLEADFQNLQIYQLDPADEKDYRDLIQDIIENKIKFNLIISTVGVLVDGKVFPEKSLKEVDIESMLYTFKVNAVSAAIIAKKMDEHIDNQNVSAFLCLSAKVGSITDNGMGGWYSYRTSKAALNMILKNIAIEFSRKKKKCIVLSIHPGTTKTGLSEKYIRNTNYKIHDPENTAKNIFKLLEARRVSDSGKFISWNGEELPW